MFYSSKTDLRTALLAGAATAVVISFSGAANADQTTVETVVVTGSRIPQPGLLSASPVTAISQDEMKFSGTTSVSTLLNSLPSIASGQVSNTGNASSGTATVDLRGLGPTRTLVLIDGLRMAPGDPVVPVPDLNQIPAALVQRVEVLTGGASAVYGSDAVAGVVNFIMRKDFEGVEIDSTFSGYGHTNNNQFQHGLLTKAGGATAGFPQADSTVWDGAGADTTIIVGTNTGNGKGNVTGYIGWQHSDPVLQSTRDVSACAVSAYRSHPTQANGQRPYDALRCAGSANYDLWYSQTGPAAGGYYFMKPGGAIVPFTGASDQYFNYGKYNSLNRPDTRFTGGFFAHYEVDPMLDIYSNFMFTDDHTSWQAAPSAAFLGAGPGPSGQLAVNCDNPLAAGTDFVADFCAGGVPSSSLAEVFVGRRNVEGGPRITDFRHTSYRMVLGAKGDLGNNWTYDVSAQYSTSLYGELYLNDLSKNRVQNALLVDPGTGQCTNDVANGCVPLDLFHGVGGITPAMLAYAYTHGQQTGYTKEQVITGALTGDLGQWGIQSPWARDPVGLSVGAEYRYDSISETTSVADQQGDLFGAGGKLLGQPLSGYGVYEGFMETRVPIIQGAPYAEDLTVSAGWRYSEYSSAGVTNAYKIGVEWQPIDDFRLRTSLNRAVRAPNVLELFTPQAVGLGSFSDPCAGASPTASLAGCVASGLSPAKYGSLLQCPAAQCDVLLGGNEFLKPEESDTRSLGIVMTPTFLPGFNATIDYYDIKVNNAIGTIDPSIAVQGCVNGNNVLCSLVHRDANGFLFTTTGGYVIETNVNTGYTKTAGVDIEANYDADLEDWGLHSAGTLSFSFLGTYVDEYRVQPYTGACQYVQNHVAKNCTASSPAPAGTVATADYDCVGLYGQACGAPTPAWRNKLRVTWASPWDFQVSLGWRYVSSVDFAGNEFNPFLRKGGYCALAGDASCTPLTASGGGHINSFNYIDLSGEWTATNMLTFHAGVNNVFDASPPLLPSGGVVAGPTGPLNGNTFPGAYDAMGRYGFVSATLKL